MTDMELALEQVRRAAVKESMGGNFPVISTFMGLTPAQILHLRDFYRRHTGKEPETI